MSRCRSNSCPVWGERENEAAVCCESASAPGDLSERDMLGVVPVEMSESEGPPPMTHEQSSALQVAALMEELQSLVRKNQELDMSLTQLRSPTAPYPQPSRAPPAQGAGLNPMAAPFQLSDSSDHERYPSPPMGYRPRFMNKRGSFSGSSQGCTPESSFCGEPAYLPAYKDWRAQEMWQESCVPPYMM